MMMETVHGQEKTTTPVMWEGRRNTHNKKNEVPW
jgi:hypothetical protein